MLGLRTATRFILLVMGGDAPWVERHHGKREAE